VVFFFDEVPHLVHFHDHSFAVGSWLIVVLGGIVSAPLQYQASTHAKHIAKGIDGHATTVKKHRERFLPQRSATQCGVRELIPIASTVPPLLISNLTGFHNMMITAPRTRVYTSLSIILITE
jgi:hypothetical protein